MKEIFKGGKTKVKEYMNSTQTGIDEFWRLKAYKVIFFSGGYDLRKKI